MQGGLLRDLVAFDAPSGAPDVFGGHGIAWTEAHVCRAQIIYAGGDEQVNSGRDAGRKRYKVRIRSCSASRRIDETYRMRDTRRSTAWNVVEVDTVHDTAWIYVVIEGPQP